MNDANHNYATLARRKEILNKGIMIAHVFSCYGWYFLQNASSLELDNLCPQNATLPFRFQTEFQYKKFGGVRKRHHF